MKIMSIHAHFDDYEFSGAGLFEKWRSLNEKLQAKVVVCTNGEAGHHFRSRQETGDLRRKEQIASSKIGQYELEFLRKPNGEYPREGCLQVDIPLLAALWQSIRSFKPDYIFCPPLATSTLAGIHNDHITVAEAVRRVAYMINVPHCFTPEYPSEEKEAEPIKVPIIINYSDNYIKNANEIDFVVNISAEFEKKIEMIWCHQSQIIEWLPWVAGTPTEKIPKNISEYSKMYAKICQKRAQLVGVLKEGLYEFFTVTAWGRRASIEDIIKIPGIDQDAFPIHKLMKSLERES